VFALVMSQRVQVLPPVPHLSAVRATQEASSQQPAAQLVALQPPDIMGDPMRAESAASAPLVTVTDAVVVPTACPAKKASTDTVTFPVWVSRRRTETGDGSGLAGASG